MGQVIWLLKKASPPGMFSFACQKRTRKAPATFEAREAAGCGSLRLLRALRGTRILQAAAPTAPPCFGRWPQSSPLQTKGCSPLIIPKLLGSIQKIQVAALKDFLCSADLKPLSRCATAPPSGSKRIRKLCGLPRNFATLPKPPSMTEGVRTRITPSAALRAAAPSKREPLAESKAS